MQRKLYTLGYEGLDIGDFLGRLRNNGVNCLIDVREIPLSRKKGFSKRTLAEKLAGADINYVHFKQLGSPKRVRDELKNTRDYPTFFSRMDAYLATQQQAIERAYQLILSRTCCLICFERNAEQCHRKLVAQKIKERDGNGLKITHI